MKKIKYRLQRMPDLCGGIGGDGIYDCIDPIVAGTVQRLILINKAVYNAATIVYDVTTANIITSIALASGDVAYFFDGVRKSIAPQTAFTPSAVSSGFDHQVDFLVFDISAAQKLNIEKMALSNGLVAIVQNINAAGNKDSVFELFGGGVGMQLQAGAMRISNDTESNSAYTLSLKTADDGGKEQHLPLSIWDTDFATTKNMVDGLLTP